MEQQQQPTGETSVPVVSTPVLLPPEALSALFTKLASGNATPEEQALAAQQAKLQNDRIVALCDEGEQLTVRFNNSEIERRASLARYEELLSDTEISKYLHKKSSGLSMAAQSHFLSTDDEAMETDIVASGYSAAAGGSGLRINKPTVKRSDILKNTKGLRNSAKNLVEKLARLRARLVKYNQCDNLQKIKKHYQFRFCAPENAEIHIYDENRKEADDKISAVVKNILIKDVNQQITSTKATLEKLPEVLEKEFEEHKSAALSSPDLSDEDRVNLTEYWDKLYQSNLRWFEFELTKIKSNHVPKVSEGSLDVYEYLITIIDQVMLNCLCDGLRIRIGTSKTPQVICQSASGSAETSHPQPQKAKGSSATAQQPEQEKQANTQEGCAGTKQTRGSKKSKSKGKGKARPKQTQGQQSPTPTAEAAAAAEAE